MTLIYSKDQTFMIRNKRILLVLTLNDQLIIGDSFSHLKILNFDRMTGVGVF